jgi:hypothetical protein
MPQDGSVADESSQFVQYVANGRRLAYHLVADAGQAGDELRDVSSGVNERCELIFDAIPLKPDRANFDNGICL